MLLLAVPAASQAATNRDLLSDANLRIDGQAASDRSGSSVSDAGDVNGDGRDDVIVGAQGAGNNGRGFSGSSYVLYGAATPARLDLATLPASQGFRIDGAAASDGSGVSVSGAGDVNGDGRDDVIVGATGADNNGRASSGSSYLIYGAASQANLDLAAMTTSQGFRIDGAAANDQLGSSVSGAGDINGDGRDDVIVGAPGADSNSRTNSGSSYVIYGAASQSNLDLAALNTSRGLRIDGAAVAEQCGSSVSAAGDVNGDGRDDLIVGAQGADTNSGSSYVLYGAATPANVDLAALTASEGFRIDGAAAFDFSGQSVSGAGDVNGDGRDDVIVGAFNAGNNGRGSSGSSYVLYGAATPANVDLAALLPAKAFASTAPPRTTRAGTRSPARAT